MLCWIYYKRACFWNMRHCKFLQRKALSRRMLCWIYYKRPCFWNMRHCKFLQRILCHGVCSADFTLMVRQGEAIADVSRRKAVVARKLYLIVCALYVIKISSKTMFFLRYGCPSVLIADGGGVIAEAADEGLSRKLSYCMYASVSFFRYGCSEGCVIVEAGCSLKRQTKGCGEQRRTYYNFL